MPSVTGTSAGPTEEISRVKALLDAGTITPAEFDSLKSTVLSNSSHNE